MKKKLFGITALLLVLCLLCACGKQKEEPASEDPPTTPFQNVYDDGGNLLVEYLVDDDGTYKGKKEYLYEEGLMKKRTYDETDKLIEEVAEEYDAQGKLIKKQTYDGIVDRKEDYVYTYNAEGKLTEMIQTTVLCDQGWGFKSVRKYNEKEQTIRILEYTLKGTLTHYLDWEYEGDRRVKVTLVNKNPSYREYHIIHYDKDGVSTGVTYYDNNDKVKEEVVYERYDWENGRICKEVSSKGYYTLIYYNENDQVVKRLSSKGHYTLYYYDEKGNALGHETYDSNGKLTGIYDAKHRPIDTPFQQP